jgi:hypothetical protein
MYWTFAVAHLQLARVAKFEGRPYAADVATARYFAARAREDS